MPTETIKCHRCRKEAIIRWEITDGMLERALKEAANSTPERIVRSVVATAKHYARNAVGFRRVIPGELSIHTVDLCSECFTEYTKIINQFMENPDHA